MASSEITSVEKVKPWCSILEKRNASGVFFLPQKPYMVLGSLRQQLLYPTWSDATTPKSDSANPNGTTFSVMPLFPDNCFYDMSEVDTLRVLLLCMIREIFYN